MKINKIYIFLAMLVATLTTTACFDDQGSDTLFGGNQVEFNAGNLPNGLAVTQVRSSPTQTNVVDIQVNRVSTSASSAVTINLEADPTSTAVSGVHYRLDATSVTIPAGSFVATIPLTILTGNIEPTETPNLVLKMTSATGAEISTAYGALTVRIRVVCPSSISVAADKWKATGTSGYGTFTADVTVTPLANGQYVISDISAGLYKAFGFATTQEVIYSDNCNKLTFVGRRATEFTITAPVVEPKVGSWDPATKTMTVYWSDVPNAINGKTVLVKQ
jgi:hypothetical protein